MGCGREAEPWDRAQVCFKVVRQAEMGVTAGKAEGCLGEELDVEHCRGAFDWKQIEGLSVGMSPAALQQD